MFTKSGISKSVYSYLESVIYIFLLQIAAEYNSPEYNLGTRRNAKFDKGMARSYIN